MRDRAKARAEALQLMIASASDDELIAALSRDAVRVIDSRTANITIRQFAAYAITQPETISVAVPAVAKGCMELASGPARRY